MRAQIHFRKVEWDDETVEYVMARLEKLKKYEWKPLVAHVTFSAERHACRTEIRLAGRGFVIKAVASGPSYPDGIDRVVGKLQRQLERKKNRVQDHLVFENTRQGKLERVIASDDQEDSELPGRKIV